MHELRTGWGCNTVAAVDWEVQKGEEGVGEELREKDEEVRGVQVIRWVVYPGEPVIWDARLERWM